MARKTKNRIPRETADMVKARADGACEALVHHVCTGQAEQLHHRQMRSQGGGHTVENLIHVCHGCHLYFHRNPQVSYDAGHLVKSHGDPAIKPVMYRGQPVILAEDGSVNHYFKPRESTGLSS